MISTRTIMFAGGGSGGHISPGLAIAERLAEIAPGSKAIFVCSQRAIDATMLREAGARFVPIPATPPALRPLAASRFVINFLKSKRMVRDLIRSEKVIHVIALGGFIAAPAVSAARSCGVPVTLVNLDAPPGRANRWMAKRCDRVLSAIATPLTPKFAQQIVGMPIRKRALAPADQRQCRARLGLDPDKPTLFVTGASQGATSINTFMMELAQSQPEIFQGWQVYHLTGQSPSQISNLTSQIPNPPSAPAVVNSYSQAGIAAKIEPFLNDIGLAWGAADLAVSRAGANSVAEAAANCVPTLFLPYPYHKDMHQRYNAQPLADAGGAVVVTDEIDPAANVRNVGPVLQQLMREPQQRDQMRARLRELPQNDAAATIARLLLA